MKFPDDRGYLELTEAERKKRAKLTNKEAKLVSRLIETVRALPPSITIDVDYDEFQVQKRITKGSAYGVARLRKKGIRFS